MWWEEANLDISLKEQVVILTLLPFLRDEQMNGTEIGSPLVLKITILFSIPLIPRGL